MRWKRWTRAKKTNRPTPRRWFAWRPVAITHPGPYGGLTTWVWLELIWRFNVRDLDPGARPGWFYITDPQAAVAAFRTEGESK